MFLKLEGQRCLVVGAGDVAESKIAGLLEAAAKVRVVAPEATPQVQSWAATGQIEWLARPCEPSDLDGMFLVIAATFSPELHEQIHAEARRRGVLCNVVDVPELCDFYYPAVVRRGALQIAVSTGGESPALAQRLRKKLEKEFRPEYAAWLKELGESRRTLYVTSEDASDRKIKLHSMASEESFRTFLHRRATKATKKKHK